MNSGIGEAISPSKPRPTRIIVRTALARVFASTFSSKRSRAVAPRSKRPVDVEGGSRGDRFGVPSRRLSAVTLLVEARRRARW